MTNSIMYGIQVMVIGMGVVFASLLGLSYVMVLLNRFFGVKEKAEPQGRSVENTTPKPVATVEASPGVPAEVIAVIAGSIAAYLDTAPEGVRIRVIRRPIPPPWSTWSMAGRQEQMNLRQMG